MNQSSYPYQLQKIDDGIYRILVPFEDLTTTVYVVRAACGTAIIDAATYPQDITESVLPALEEAGIPLSDVRSILLTHSHSDHAGGLPTLKKHIPHATVMSMTPFSIPDFHLLCDGDTVLGRLLVVHLPGHTEMSCGFFDQKTKTLLSGDCLQLSGVGKYTHGVSLPDQYRASMQRLKGMDVLRIVASHEYLPLGSIAEGADAVKRYLDACIALAGGKR